MPLEHIGEYSRESHRAPVDVYKGQSKAKEVEMERYFNELYHVNVLEALGREKTIEEQKLIDDTYENMGEFLQQYNVDFRPLDKKRIIFLDEKKLDETMHASLVETKMAGRYSPDYFTILQAPLASKLEQARNLVHELMHSASFVSKIASTDTSVYYTGRFGLAMKEHTWTINDDEALTEELTRRFCQTYFPRMEFTKEPWDEREKKLSEEHVPQDIREQVLQVVENKQEDGTAVRNLMGFSHDFERAVLWNKITRASEASGSTHKSTEDIFEDVVHAKFSKDLRPYVAMVKQAYNNEKLREIEEKHFTRMSIPITKVVGERNKDAHGVVQQQGDIVSPVAHATKTDPNTMNIFANPFAVKKVILYDGRTTNV